MTPLKWTAHNLTPNDPLCLTTHEPTTVLIPVLVSPTLTISSRATPVITVRQRFTITTQVIRTVRTTHTTLPTITRGVALVAPVILVLLRDTTSLEGQSAW